MYTYCGKHTRNTHQGERPIWILSLVDFWNILTKVLVHWWNIDNFLLDYISECAPPPRLEDAILEQSERKHHFTNQYKQPYQSVKKYN